MQVLVLLWQKGASGWRRRWMRGVRKCGRAESYAARKPVYAERSEVLKANAEARASWPKLDEVDEGNPYYRPWDSSIWNDASPYCNCGYADGVYDWCECVGQVKTWSDNEACYSDEESLSGEERVND